MWQWTWLFRLFLSLSWMFSLYKTHPVPLGVGFFSSFTQWELTFLASATPQFHLFKRYLLRQSATPWETVAGHMWPVPLRPPQHRGHLPGEWTQIPPAQGRRSWWKEEHVPPSERSPSHQDAAHFLRGGLASRRDWRNALPLISLCTEWHFIRCPGAATCANWCPRALWFIARLPVSVG